MYLEPAQRNLIAESFQASDVVTVLFFGLGRADQVGLDELLDMGDASVARRRICPARQRGLARARPAASM